MIQDERQKKIDRILKIQRIQELQGGLTDSSTTQGKPPSGFVEQMAEGVGQTFPALAEAGQMIQRNPVAGMARAGRESLEELGKPFGYVDEAIRSIPPQPRGGDPALLLDLLGLIPRGAGMATKAIAQSGLGYAGLAFPNLGTTPEKANQIRREVPALAETFGSFAVPAMGIGKLRETAISAKNVAKGTVRYNQAFPIASAELNRPYDMQKMRPYLAEEQRANPMKPGNMPKGGEKPSIARQLAEERYPKIKQKIWDEQSKFIERNDPIPLRNGVEPIAQNIESLQNTYTKNIDLAKDQSIIAEAKKFRALKEISVGEASEMMRHLNADLQKLYKQSSESQAAATNAAKPIAEMERAARAIRDEIAKTLQARGENVGRFKKLHDDYGAAIRQEVVAWKNIARAESPLPPLFTERSSTLYPSKAGVLRDIGEHTLGKFATPDKLAYRALNRFAKSKLKP